MITDINIHGDNIVECERVLDLILQSTKDDIETFDMLNDSIVCPSFQIKYKTEGKKIKITFFPGFGRWEVDILSTIQERNNALIEVADAVVTEVINDIERPIFAIEFCGALPAGNQAWQRSGRAYSFGAIKVPYLYISELGGYELDSNRNRKASRMPNPAVPFSYISFSIEKNTPVLPVFIKAPGADEIHCKTYSDEFGYQELLCLLRAILFNTDTSSVFSILQKKVLSFVKKRGENSRKEETLSAEQWQRAFDNIQEGKTISDFLIEEVKQPWRKTAYISSLTDNAKRLIEIGKEIGIGYTSTRLPICLFDREKRQIFMNYLNNMYPLLDDDFVKWLEKEEPLVVCWITGFKPKGDDSRPDRGLPPFARMIIGSNHDLLSIVYGPALRSTWETLEENPNDLSQKNGLWQAILEISDAVLIESATDDNITRKGYIDLQLKKEPSFIVPSSPRVPPMPIRFGENDVDTVIHILLSRLCGDDVFEGMCNPPGGDWSGISVLSGDKEYRWVSLPRVSGKNTKRPDHVFQIFIPNESSIILSIESKRTPQMLEKHIGSSLTAYVYYLLSKKASIERPIGNSDWLRSEKQLNLSEYQFVTAGAFLNQGSEKNLIGVNKSETDLNFSVGFSDKKEKCTISIYVATKIGAKIAEFIKSKISDESHIQVEILLINN